jgi:hypothetical protein
LIQSGVQAVEFRTQLTCQIDAQTFGFDLVAQMMLDDLFELGISHAPAALSHAQSYPRLAPIGEFHASGLENLTNAGDGAGAYFFASLETDDCLASDPCGGR